MLNKPRVEDTLPWYRQFWPWFLIALPGSVVIAGFVMLYIANLYSDDLVVDEYYKDGLAINRQLERKRLAGELGLSAEIRVLDRLVQLRLDSGPGSESAEQAVPGDLIGTHAPQSTPGSGDLRLTLSHPLEADRDFHVALERRAPGLYGATMPSTVAPHWHWTLESQSGEWRLDGSLARTNFLDGVPSS